MKERSKLNRLLSKRRRILIEAAMNSMLAWVMIRMLPYSVWKRWLGEPVSLSEVSQELRIPKESDGKLISDIAWAHRRLSKQSRGFFTCLMLGFSARAMLRRRGNYSILVLGVGREAEDLEPGLGAHAWVVHDRFDIAGGNQRHRFAAVAAYCS